MPWRETSLGPPFPSPAFLESSCLTVWQPRPSSGPRRLSPPSKLALSAEAVTPSGLAGVPARPETFPASDLPLGGLWGHIGEARALFQASSFLDTLTPHTHFGVTENPSLGLRRGDWRASVNRGPGSVPPLICLRDRLRDQQQTPAAPTPPTRASPGGPDLVMRSVPQV